MPTPRMIIQLGSQAILDTNGFQTPINTESGGIGFFDSCHEYWLNIHDSTTAKKPL